jgi:hypothetical protein
MNGQLDITKAHSKTVKAIVDLKKQFNAAKKGGTCQKFQLIFDDGYEAEYCPLIGQFDPNIKSGASMTFKIVHRGNFGDEIEPYFSQSGSNPSGPRQFPTGIPANMNAHPATIALHASLRFNEGKEKDQKADLDTILSDADTIQQWLYDKIEQTNF